MLTRFQRCPQISDSLSVLPALPTWRFFGLPARFDTGVFSGRARLQLCHKLPVKAEASAAEVRFYSNRSARLFQAAGPAAAGTGFANSLLTRSDIFAPFDTQ
jgi:hypothetical protein